MAIMNSESPKKPNPRRFFRRLFLDYGSFTGALIGAAGTIAAGYLAWVGVQDQLDQQKFSNFISEQALINYEIEGLQKRVFALKDASVLFNTISNIENWGRNYKGKEIAYPYTRALLDLRAKGTVAITTDNALAVKIRETVTGPIGLKSHDILEVLNRAYRYEDQGGHDSIADGYFDAKTKEAAEESLAIIEDIKTDINATTSKLLDISKARKLTYSE